jgi:hypothetical protein
LSTCDTLNCEIRESDLQHEYKFTRNWYTITSYFVTLLTLQIHGVSQEQEDNFIADINRLDLKRDGDEMRDTVRSFGEPVKTLCKNVVQFLENVETEELDRLERLVIDLNLLE